MILNNHPALVTKENGIAVSPAHVAGDSRSAAREGNPELSPLTLSPNHATTALLWANSVNGLKRTDESKNELDNYLLHHLVYRSTPSPRTA